MATEYNSNKVKSKLGWSNAFSPDGAFPLDIRSYFGSYEAAAAAANTAEDFGSTSSQYYLGQQLYVFDGVSAKTYLIQGDKSLKEIGSQQSSMLFVASESEMLQITDISAGQQVYREDTKSIWIYKGGTIADVSNWAESASQSDVVWYGTTDKVNFYALTNSAYKQIASPASNTLYFITDQSKIFKGSTDMTNCIIPVHPIPDCSDAQPGKLYFDTSSFEIKLTTDNTSWCVASPGYLTDGANWAEADGNKFATISLIKSGIAQAISQLKFDNDSGTISIGSSASAVLSGVAHNVDYDIDQLKLTIPIYGSDSIEINIPKDKFVKSGRYNSETHNIELTLQSQSDPVLIPAGDLIDIYTADNSKGNVQISVSRDNKISATITIDSDSANRLKYDSVKGFSVDVSDKMSAVKGAVENNVAILTAAGNVKDSTIKIGSDSLEQSVSASTIATEKAVKQYVDDTLSWSSISE